MNSILPEKPYDALIATITSTYDQGRLRAVQAVNVQLLETYWQIGRHIVEFEQAGSAKAGYGKSLIKQLVTDLTLRFGKGFSRSNLIRIRQFYLLYPKGASLPHFLTWTHVVDLVFYHRILRCFVLMDLKIKDAQT